MFPNLEFDIQKRYVSPIKFEYFFIADAILAHFLLREDYERITGLVKVTNYDNNIPQHIYRQIGEKYVNALFDKEKGELFLSTFGRCRKLESKRCDKYELRNKIKIYSKSYRIETDLQMDNDYIVLCTSNPEYENFDNRNDWIKINDVNNYIADLTDLLVSLGFDIYEVVFGRCKYSNKTIEFNDDENYTLYETAISNNMLALESINSNINNKCENDMLMNKPTYFSKEKEFRIVFKLNDLDLKKENTGKVKFVDGGIVINALELIKYYDRL